MKAFGHNFFYSRNILGSKVKCPPCGGSPAALHLFPCYTSSLSSSLDPHNLLFSPLTLSLSMIMSILKSGSCNLKMEKNGVSKLFTFLDNRHQNTRYLHSLMSLSIPLEIGFQENLLHKLVS